MILRYEMAKLKVIAVYFLFILLLHASTEIVEQPTDLFTVYFPCTPETSTMITQQDAQSCDLFVYAAVQLALDKAVEENGLRIAVTSIDAGESDKVTDIQG